MVKTEYQNQLYLLLETGRKLSFGRLLTNNTLAMMRFVFILFIFVTSCHWLSAQDTLNYGKIREAHRLMELYNNYSGTKPIYAERCRDSAIYFLDQEIVSNRIISVSFPEGGLINMVLGTIELHDYDDVTLNFNFFRNSHTGTSPYASNNTVLEKLENIEPDKPFTCTFKIVPAKETYDVKTQRYINTPYFAAGFYIAIYVQILEIKLDSIKVKNIESDTTANINNRISTFKWGASSPTKDTLKQKSSIGNDPNTNGFGTYSPSGYSLNSRAVKSMPSPSNKENTEGKVVVIIQVDRDGNVVKAEAGAVGTTVAGAGIMLSSCVSSKKFKAEAAKLEDLQRTYAALQGDLGDCEKAKADLSNAKRNTEAENVALQRKIEDLLQQIEFLKQNNNTVLGQLKDMSVISGTQAESIKKSLEAIGSKDAYIQDLQSAMSRKDSLNLALVLNLKRALSDINDSDVEIKVEKSAVYISISDKLLFKSGSYDVTDKAMVVLGKVAQVLKAQPNIEFLVEGHTDTVPIKTAAIKDNWDLSVLRATSVVRILQNNFGLEPQRMTAGGRSQYLPVADNSTPDGRAVNRRTRIVILPQLDQFFKLLEPQK